MIRWVVLASAGVMALAGTALAADLAPPPAPPPPPLWTLGVNAGYDWANSNGVQTTADPLFAAPTWSTELALSTALATGDPGLKPNGFIGGGQIGYNYQFANSFVIGLEGDLQGIAATPPPTHSAVAEFLSARLLKRSTRL